MVLLLGFTLNGTKPSLFIVAIAFSLFILILSSGHFEWCSNILNRRDQNVTTKDLLSREITCDGLGTKNFTVSNLDSKNRSSPSKSHADKHLDGLFSSGFDKGSCLSRYQSYLYRKVSPHKPSPYFISKLRRYEDLHRRCGPHTRAYKRTMVKLNRFKSNVTTGSCKYMIWTAVNGLGNRMVSMASVFLYAIVTDRVLLVEFHDEMVGLFCEPFPNSSWILPKDFPLSDNSKGQYFETYESMLKRDKENISKELLLPSIIGVHLNMYHSINEHELFFSCDHSQHLLHKVPLLIVTSDQYFVPALFMVPSFNQELNKMFPNKDIIFHLLGRYLFLPSNDVWGPIKRFYQAYLARAEVKIGIQIRVFNPQLTPYETIMGQVLKCTQKHKILPDFAANISKDPPLKNQILKSVLVASLYPEYGENLRTMYLNKPTVTGEIIGVYQPSHEDHQKFYDNLHFKKALTDIYLLSLCDVLVTSSESSFGYVAQGLGSIKPLVLRKLLDSNIPDTPCLQDFSTEPCYLITPKLDCTEKPIDIGTIFPYMKRCVDYQSGVKLVNDIL